MTPVVFWCVLVLYMFYICQGWPVSNEFPFFKKYSKILFMLSLMFM
jgi:hypothetical protein